jgi:hypothetical protein
MAARRERVRITCRRAIPVPCTPGLVGSQQSLMVTHVTLTWLAPLQVDDSTNGKDGVEAGIGLAVPGRPIGPWSRRTGAPEASATRRDRNSDAHGVAHGTGRGTPG